MNEVQIACATEADDALVEAVRRFIAQLSSSKTPVQPSREDLQRAIESSRLLIARSQGRIVGMLSLVVFRIPTGTRALIEDVVVDREHRGRGIGEALTRHAIELACASSARTIDLTSRPERVAANALYRKLGFVQRETNVYRLICTDPR
jgi:ribosomal protein S18 acetylase RimI-like enzyme